MDPFHHSTYVGLFFQEMLCRYKVILIHKFTLNVINMKCKIKSSIILLAVRQAAQERILKK